MNTTIRTLLNLEAAGTSEGAKKGWENRGYGQDETEKFGPSEKLPKGKGNPNPPEGPPWYGAPRVTGYDKWFSEQKHGDGKDISHFGDKHIAPLKAKGTSEGAKKGWDSRSRRSIEDAPVGREADDMKENELTEEEERSGDGPVGREFDDMKERPLRRKSRQVRLKEPEEDGERYDRQYPVQY